MKRVFKLIIVFWILLFFIELLLYPIKETMPVLYQILHVTFYVLGGYIYMKYTDKKKSEGNNE